MNMHSRIYELKKHEDDEDELYEYTINNETMDHYGMDYVSEMDEDGTKDSIQWLQDSYRDSIKIDQETKALQFTDLNNMMRSSFAFFKKTLTELNKVRIEDFIGTGNSFNSMSDLGLLMYQLNNAYANDTGFYIYYDECFMPMNTFVRKYLDDVRTATFYIGNVLDYHC